MHIYAQVICKHYDILYKGFENLKILVSLEVPQPISHGYGLQFLVHKSWGKHKLRTGHLASYWGICGPGWSAISPTWLQMTSCEMLVRIVLVHVAAHPRLSSTLLSLCCMSPEKKVLSSPCSPVQRNLSTPSIRLSVSAFFCPHHLNTCSCLVSVLFLWLGSWCSSWGEWLWVRQTWVWILVLYLLAVQY